MVRTVQLDPYLQDRLTQSPLSVDLRTVTTESGLDFGTASVVREEPADTLVMVQPWSQYCERPDIVTQLPLFSEATGKHIVMINHLGVGQTTSDVPASMSRDFRQGNFAPLIHEQEEILHRLCPSLGRLSLLGYSEGANLAAAYAAYSTDHIDAMTLLETVSFEDHSLARMIGHFVHEAFRKYREPADEFTNFKHTQVAPNEIAVTLHGLYDYPRGIANSSIYADIDRAYENSALDVNSNIAIVNGDRSYISPTAKNAQLARVVEQIAHGPVTHTVLSGETHAIKDYPTVVRALGQI